MFLVWTGKGYVVFVIFAASFFVSWPLEALIAPFLGLSGNLTGQTSTLDPHFLLLATIATAISSIASYPVSRFVLKQPAPQILVDPETGKSYATNLDTMYRIETKYWTYIFAALFAGLLALTIASS